MNHRGFTLIELSIVLVIIGLIAGGILVGQDMIEMARYRAGITQLEEYSTAINTFRLKYNAMPGDYLNAYTMGITQDENGNFLTCTRHPADQTYRSGNGNGILNDGNHSTMVYHNGEYAHFWGHLRGAKLFNDISHIFSALELCGPMQANILYPEAKGPGESVLAVGNFGDIYFLLGAKPKDATYNLGNALGDTTGHLGPFSMPQLTPEEAKHFDDKIDDGSPLNGQVFATRLCLSTNGSDCSLVKDIAGGSTSCVAANSTYNIADKDDECILAIKAQ